MSTHSVERISPKGEAFVGVCMLCGATNLKPADVFKECPNPSGVSQDDALLQAIDPDRGDTQ